MVKQRMASADVAGEVSCLKSKVVGLRLANLYDLNAKTYVLKLSKSGSDGEKLFLLLESGTRFHTVQVMYDKPDAPSNFTLKLRKHLRTRRLEDVRQLGVDRVVDFVFGLGENAHHLILEMYAQGNVVLTDSSYQVLTLLRSHRDDDKGLSIMAKHPYPMHAIRLRQPLLLPTLKAALAAPEDAAAAAAAGVTAGGLVAAANGTAAAAVVDGDYTDQLQAADDADLSTHETAAHTRAAAPAVGAWGKKGKKGSKDSGPVLKTIISDLVPYGPAVAEHCCLSAGLQPQHPVSQQPLTEQQVDELFAAVQQFEAWLASLDQAAVAEGYIAAQPAAGAKQQQGQQQAAYSKPAADQNGTAADSQQQQQSTTHGDRGAGLVYQDYNPLRIAQLSKAVEVLTFHTFDDALDEFYSKIQGQRVESAKLDAERAALSRLDKIRTDQGARATALEREAADSELRATLIEYNLEAVDAAIDAVNAAIATGMDWHDLEVLIKEERRAGNPVAGSIHSLQLDQNKITLLLSNMLDDEEDDEAALTRPATKVQVDLSLTAYSNTAAHHASRKKQLSKQEKTVAAHTEALKAAEKKAEKQLANLRNNVTTAQVVRKAAWFERFHWFISSENYLVISGRDAQQNELIVKRYFRKDDIYVHAELHGASSTIVRNHDPTRPVPPLTLQQAGCACVCRSRAWDSKVVTSAWWVYHSQVSKTAPTGEYLPTGSFMVRGKKQFLPPQGLVMGFGFMFKLEDSCIGRHAGERAVKGGLDDWEQQQQQQQGVASDADQDGATELESTVSGAPSAALASEASSTSALDSFLDMSADQLAAATRAASSSSTGQRGGTGFERYGLTHSAAAAAVDYEGMQDGEAQQQGSKVQADSKRYISAAERAKLKKAAKPGSTAPPQQQQAPQHQQQKSKAEGSSNKSTAGTKAAAAGADAGASVPKVSRGKKGKAAKAKEKYAEQDDDDRELALQVLGSAGAKKTRQDRRQQRKVAREEARQTQSGLTGALGNQQEAIRKAIGSQFSDLTAAAAAAVLEGEDGPAGTDQDSSSNSGEDTGPTQAVTSAAGAPAGAGAEGLAVDIDAAGADRDGDGARAAAGEHVHSSDKINNAAAEGEAGSAAAGAAAAAADSDDNVDELAAAADEAERAEISALLAEENIAETVYEEGDAAAAALKELDSLTGCPRPDDVLMYAVPVCGPYAALANYKYKVKLTPGTLKKGKAVKQAVEVVVRGQDVLPRERELVRACPDADKINAMVGTVKISAAGLQQIKQASKKAKKAAAQSKAAS